MTFSSIFLFVAAFGITVLQFLLIMANDNHYHKTGIPCSVHL